MILTIGKQYKTIDGFITPLSHFKQEKGVKYAIFRWLEITDTGYRMRHVTFTKSELKKKLELPKDEKVEVL